MNTVDRVLMGRGKVKNKANGPGDSGASNGNRVRNHSLLWKKIQRKKGFGDSRPSRQIGTRQWWLGCCNKNRDQQARGGGEGRCLVTEMLQCFPTETVYEVSHWFDKRFKGESLAPEAWKILRLVFLKKPDARLERDLRGSRAIALLSVLSKWYTSVFVGLVHVGAERGVNCEHMQAFLTDILQRHCEEDRAGRTIPASSSKDGV